MAHDLEYSLGMNTGPFQKAADQAIAAAATAGKEITKKFELKDVGRTLATALGINLPSIAESIARFVAGVSKAEEEALNKLGELSTQVADKQLAAMRERLTDEQRYQLLLTEQERIQQRLADNLQKTTADQVRYKQDQLALMENEKAAAQSLAKIQADAAALIDARYANEKKLAADLAKIKADDAEADRKARQSEYDFAQDVEQKRLAYLDQNFERLSLEAKSVRGLTQEETARLAELRLITKQLEIESQIRTLLSLEKRTPEEEAALTLLFRQNDQLTAQIAAKQQLTEVTGQQVAAEEAVGEAIGFALGKLKSFVAEWTGFTISVQTMGRGNAELSDRELQRKAANLRSDIAERQRREMQRGAIAGIGGNADLMLPGQQITLSQLQNELRLRDEVRRAVDSFGEDRAFQMFQLTEQRFADILRGTTEDQRLARQTADGITELNNRLRAGIPVINLNTTGN